MKTVMLVAIAIDLLKRAATYFPPILLFCEQQICVEIIINKIQLGIKKKKMFAAISYHAHFVLSLTCNFLLSLDLWHTDFMSKLQTKLTRQLKNELWSVL